MNHARDPKNEIISRFFIFLSFILLVFLFLNLSLISFYFSFIGLGLFSAMITHQFNHYQQQDKEKASLKNIFFQSLLFGILVSSAFVFSLFVFPDFLLIGLIFIKDTAGITSFAQITGLLFSVSFLTRMLLLLKNPICSHQKSVSLDNRQEPVPSLVLPEQEDLPPSYEEAIATAPFLSLYHSISPSSPLVGRQSRSASRFPTGAI